MEAVAARAIQVLAALGGAYLIALWFVLVVWTYRDIEARSRNVVTQVFSTLLVVLFSLPGVLLYMILRPKETLDVAFQRSLEEEYLLQDLEELPVCRSCQHYVEDDFMICPHCQTHLRDACVACTRLVDLRWNVCPYCGAEQSRAAEQASETVPQPAARWAAPAVIKRRILRQVPTAEPTALPAPLERPVAVIAATTDGTLPLPPVRLFDRRKTREALRLNGYRQPVAVNGNGNGHHTGHAATITAASLVDRFGRSMDGDGPDGLMNGIDSGTDERSAEPALRVPAGAEETGD